MNLFCPVLSNKRVKDKFNQLSEAVGEDRAYYLWNKNNGYGPESTADSGKSGLYQKCLKYANGNKNVAAEIKSAIYSKNLPDDVSSFDDIKEDYKQYRKQPGIKEQLDKVPIRLETVHDVLANSLNLQSSVFEDCIVPATRPSVRDIVIELGKNNFLSDANKNLFDKLSKVDCPVVIDQAPTDNDIAWFDGLAIHLTDKVLNLADKDLAVTIILHEYVHAATASVMNDPKTDEDIDFVNKILNVYDEYKTALPSNAYGFTNEYEFVSEFMSNPTFREELRSKHWYTRLINNIKSFFTHKKYQMSKSEVEELGNNIQHIIESGYTNNNYFQRVPLKYKLNADSKSINDILNKNMSFKTQLESAKSKIITGLRSRMKSLEYRGSLTYESKRNLQDYIERLNRVDGLSAVVDFIHDNLADVCAKTDDYVNKLQVDIAASKGVMSKESIIAYAKSLENVDKDFIGFYDYITETLNSLISNHTGELSEDIKKLNLPTDISSLVNVLTYAKQHIENVKAVYSQLSSLMAKQIIAEQYGDLTDRDADGNERVIDDVVQAINWVDSAFDENQKLVYQAGQTDINSVSAFVGQHSSSNNALIRIVADQISRGKNEVERDTYSVGIKLRNALLKVKKTSGMSSVTLLQEKDDKGNTTGFVTRDLKYGLLLQDIHNLRKELGEKYKLPTDSDGNFIPPEYNVDGYDEKVFDGYWSDFDNWMDKHCNRKYTKEYYSALRKLSPETKNALSDINSQISKILNSVRSNPDEAPDLMKLSDENYRKLHSLNNQKKALSFDYDSNGNLKEGDALKVAREIQALNKIKQDKLSYKVKSTFKEAVKKAEKKYGKDSKEYSRWVARNTDIVVPEDFYDTFNSKEKTQALEAILNDEQLIELKKQEKAIIQQYRRIGDIGYAVESMPKEIKEKLKEIDIAIYKRTKGIASVFKDDTMDEDRVSAMSLSPYYTKLYYEILNSGAPDAKKEAKKFVFENSYELISVIKPLRAWYDFAPADRSKMKREPNRFWQELDVDNSEFANKDYEQTNEIYQPKRIDRYVNKDFDKIKSNAELYNLYNTIIDVMTKANSHIAFQERPNPYRLPQMSGRMSSVLYRSHGKILNALRFKLGDLAKVRDYDTDFVERKDVRADGTKITNVPVRFIQMLEDPSKLTSDVVGSVIMFYQMAKNYDVMTNDVAPRLEMLAKQAFNKRNIVKQHRVESVSKGSTNVYKEIQHILDMHVYGEKSKAIKINLFGREINLTKVLNAMYNYYSAVHLAFNFNTSLVGFTTGLVSANTEAMLGKYFNKVDHAWAKAEFGKYVPDILLHLGDISYTNKLICAMDYNNVTRSNNDIFGKLDQNRVLRFIGTHLLYGSYTIGDTAVKGTTTMAIYRSIRLCNVNGIQKFMRREDFVNRYYPKNSKEGNRVFDSFKTTLWDAYDVKDKEFTLNPKYKAYVTPKFESDVKNLLDAINVRNDGQISDLDRSAIYADALTHYVVQHRNFLMLFQERFKRTQYNFKTNTLESGYYYSVAKLFKSMSKRDMVHIDKIMQTYHSLSKSEQYGVRRVLIDISYIIAINTVSSIFLAAANKQTGGDETWLTQELAYAFEKTRFEMGTYYKPDDLLGLLKSPSASSTDINNMFGLLECLVPTNWSQYKSFIKEGKTGVYKGIPWYGKQLIKLTPIKNALESVNAQSIKAKRKYQENQIQNGF